MSRRKKHPRIRGESISLAALTIMQLETSPHTRGKPLQTGISLQSRRNIPAYAGKAAGHFRLTAASRKHPRIRGESLSVDLFIENSLETSPHTRGKRPWRKLALVCFGNIPAYAGKASKERSASKATRKHPRIRGESSQTAEPEFSKTETSPHTRGKHTEILRSHFGVRNIPAYAGKAITGDISCSLERNIPAYAGKALRARYC